MKNEKVTEMKDKETIINRLESGILEADSFATSFVLRFGSDALKVYESDYITLEEKLFFKIRSQIVDRLKESLSEDQVHKIIISLIDVREQFQAIRKICEPSLISYYEGAILGVNESITEIKRLHGFEDCTFPVELRSYK